MLSHEKRCGVLALISISAVMALLFVGPISQDPNYHLFADSRHVAGVRNFWNIVSNLPFLLAGTLGFLRYSQFSHQELAQSYLVVCVGIVLVGFGSAYYHYAPSNDTLLWDRLPMAVVFMAAFSLLLDERVTHTPRRHLLWVLVSAGAASVFYWSWTESLGRGDLRPYALVQFLPVLLMPLMLVMFHQRYLSNRLLCASFGLYFVAKAFEQFDGEVFSVTGFMSGHSIKHVVAATAVLCIVYAVPTMPKRR